MRIRPLVSRSRSRRRRARASHRRSRRSRRHRRRHHRSGMSHTITPSAHRRSLSRNHPPRPSSTVARIVISHHESTMTMRGGANETRVRSRLRVPLSLSLSRVVDRSFDRVSMPPFASRPSRTPVLARARQSHPITCNSFITRARRAVLAGIDRLDGPARAPFHIHTQTPIDRSNKKKQSPHAQQKIKTKNRTGGTIPARASASRPRARAASTRRSIARESSSRARETSTRPRDSRASLECDAFARSVGRSSRSMDEGDGGRARMDARRARMDARRARTARAMRTRAKRKSRCEGMKTGERDGGRDRGTRARRVRRSFGDDSRRASTRSND